MLSRKVEFLLVGGYALAFHGAARFTEDIDFLVLVSPENAGKLADLIKDFGFGELGLSWQDFLDPDQVIQLGRAPHRIDLLTGISGVRWEEAWSSRIEADFDGFLIPVINLWLGFRCLACPVGYAVRKKLDGMGKLVAVLYWVAILGGVGLMAAGMVGAFGELKDSGVISDFTKQFEDLRKSAVPER